MAGLAIHRKREFPFKVTIFLFFVCLTIATVGWYYYRWYTTGETPPVVQAKGGDPRIAEKPVTKQEIADHTVPATNPRYISIPSLDISNTRVFSVGVTRNGQLDVPKNIDDAAWYDKSATPGTGYGAVLLDGHNGGISRNGVFAKLSTLQQGDLIKIERGDGDIFTYEVAESQSMSLDEVNKTGMQMMMKSADEDKEGLNIITCDGKWVPRLQQFDRRIMLRAVRVDA